jgi:hypothetical protein
MKTSQVFRASFQSNLCKIRIFFVVVAVIPDNILRNHFILGVAHSHLGAAVHMILLLNTGPFKGLVSRDACFLGGEKKLYQYYVRQLLQFV